MFKRVFCFVFILSSCLLSSLSYSKESNKDKKPKVKAWSGSMIRLGLGGVFDFESNFNNKGDGRPSSALLSYGFEYGFPFAQRYFFSLGLDWSIVYPRNFENLNNGFFEANAALWYTPITHVQFGYMPSEDWLVTLGLAYFWGATFSVRYKVKDFLFIDTRGIVWMDRVFDTNGAFDEGFDNFQWTFGFGFIL